MNVFSRVNQALFPGAKEYPKVGAGKMALLGLQHAFAMSCATILVPLLTGLDVGVALFAAGIGTLIFHLCTRGKMPTFLGSSFAFIAALQAVIGSETEEADAMSEGEKRARAIDDFLASLQAQREVLGIPPAASPQEFSDEYWDNLFYEAKTERLAERGLW